MYFDLNLDIVQPQTIEKERENSTSATNTELSGTSSASSVVNAADSPISGEVAGEYITRQLFPVTISDDENVNTAGCFNGREKELEELRLGSSQPSSSNQWLNLTVSGSGSGSGSGLGSVVGPNPKQQVRKSRRGPRSRSSQYRGVTFYRRTGRWESHIWDCGKQVYLGGFDTAHAAARAYDRAAIKFRGVDADINFNITDYDEDMTQVKNLSKEEFVQILRRQNNGFSRGSSRYRGVATQKVGRWEAPTGQFPGNVSDQAALQCNGRAAVTNLESSTYDRHSQIPMPVNHQGDGHNLDLNLGISITIDGPKARNYMSVGESQTYHSPIQLANGKRPLNGVSPYHSTGALPLYGQPMASRQSSTTWPGLPQGRPEAYEEKASEQKAEARPSNWAWYMERQGQGGGGTTPNQVHFLSRAASSGFPFSTATTSTTFFTHLPPSHSHNDLHPYGEGRS